VTSRQRLVTAAAVGVAVLACVVPASASTWTLTVRAVSNAEAQAKSPPGRPSGVSAACVSTLGAGIQVSWSSVAGATSYAVYDSTTTSSGTYSPAGSGITSTSWTNSFGAGNYYFEVQADQGANWASANSSPTGETTISLGLLCTQP